jgi:hypothetical protein
MKLALSPVEAPYVIRHKSQKKAYIKHATMPPRTCDWTEDIDEAEVFEHEREAQYCADFITKYAFDVEVYKK